MIPKHLALVTQKPLRQAAMQAIIDVEQRLAAGKYVPENAYAKAFFRLMTGNSRIRSRDLWQVGVHRSSRQWQGGISELERAFDVLLRTQGECCPITLDYDICQSIFPSLVFKQRQRDERRRDLNYHKKQRYQDKLRERDALRHRNLIDRAAIDLNFQSPATVGDWYRRWEDDIQDEELERLFWRWVMRFPSLIEIRALKGMGRPLWSIIITVAEIVTETPQIVRAIESLYVPNKLRGIEG